MTGETNLVAAAERRTIDGATKGCRRISISRRQQRQRPAIFMAWRVIDAASRVESPTDDELRRADTI